jgi:hypothetical protein
MQLPSHFSLRPSLKAESNRANSTAIAGLLLAALFISGCKNPLSVQQPAARTDQQVATDTQAKIGGESALAGQNIEAAASNGVVTLNGTVSDEASRALAANDAGSIAGVKTVINNLTVQSAKEQPAQAPVQPPPARVEKPRAEASHDRRPVMAQAAPAPAPQPVPPAQLNNTPPPQSVAAAPPPAPPKPITQNYTIDSGTTVPITITEALTSQTAQPNDTFHGTLATDLVSNGVVVIPRGASVLGRVVEVHEAAHFKGAALLTLELTQVSSRGRKITLVTDTFAKQGAARGKNTAMKAGGGAALGAIIGAIAGGGQGAAIGAAAGAGAGTGVNAVTRGEQAKIESETRLEFHLQSPVTVSITSTPGQARAPYDGSNSEPQLQPR